MIEEGFPLVDIIDIFERNLNITPILGFPGKRFPGSREICEENYLIFSPNCTSFLREIILSLVRIYILFLFTFMEHVL